MNIFKMFDEHVIGTTSGHFMIVCTPNNDSSVVRRATELMTSAHMYRRVIFMNSGSASTLEQALADVIDARVEPFSVGDLTNTLLIVPASWAWCPVVRDLMTSHAGGSMIVVANQLSDMPGSVRANANYIMFDAEEIPDDIVQAVSACDVVCTNNPFTTGHVGGYPVFSNFAMFPDDVWRVAATNTGVVGDAHTDMGSVYVPTPSKLMLDPLPQSPTSAAAAGGCMAAHDALDWIPSPEKDRTAFRTADDVSAVDDVDVEQEYLDAMNEAVGHSESAWLSQASTKMRDARSAVGSVPFAADEGDIFADVSRLEACGNVFKMGLPVSPVTVRQRPVFKDETEQVVTSALSELVRGQMTLLEATTDANEERDILQSGQRTILGTQRIVGDGLDAITTKVDVVLDTQHIVGEGLDAITAKADTVLDAQASVSDQLDDLAYEQASLAERVAVGHNATYTAMNEGQNALYDTVNEGHETLYGAVVDGHGALHNAMDAGHAVLYTAVKEGHEAMQNFNQTTSAEQERTTELLVDNQNTLQTNQESIVANQGVMHKALTSLRAKVDEMFAQFASCLARTVSVPTKKAKGKKKTSAKKSKKKKKKTSTKKKATKKEGEEKKKATHRTKEEQRVVQAAFERWLDATAQRQDEEGRVRELTRQDQLRRYRRRVAFKGSSPVQEDMYWVLLSVWNDVYRGKAETRVRLAKRAFKKKSSKERLSSWFVPLEPGKNFVKMDKAEDEDSWTAYTPFSSDEDDEYLSYLDGVDFDLDTNVNIAVDKWLNELRSAQQARAAEKAAENEAKEMVLQVSRQMQVNDELLRRKEEADAIELAKRVRETQRLKKSMGVIAANIYSAQLEVNDLHKMYNEQLEQYRHAMA